jgi:hypothetical protein
MHMKFQQIIHSYVCKYPFNAHKLSQKIYEQSKFDKIII